MSVRTLFSKEIIPLIVQEIGKITCQLDTDVENSLQRMREVEKSELSRDVLDILVENASLARTEKIPLCQDTGTLVVFASMGKDLYLADLTLQEILDEAMQIAQQEYYLRASMVKDPIYQRKNTLNNCPVILHLEMIPGDRLTLCIAQKGGGAENMSRLQMFSPSADENEIINFVVETVKRAGSKACPPLIIGIGIGGNFETCALLAKRAIFDPLTKENEHPNYAELEKRILSAVNDTGIGVQGMGGEGTALAVKIRTSPCHLASLPVAVNLQCHAHRHTEITF